MGQRIAGTCYVKMDGQQLEIKGGLEAPIAEVKREPVLSSSGVVGFKESPVVQTLKVTGIFTRDFPIDTLKTATDLTVTGEFANGKVYTLSGAWLSNEGSTKGEEGEVDLEFSGTRGIWQ